MRDGKNAVWGVAALRMAVVLAAIAALLWQSFVVQTHIHYPAVSVHAPASTYSASGISRRGHPADPPADCPICREMAQAAAYLTPAPPPLIAPMLAHVMLANLPILPSVILAFAPAWRSRAPPLRRHA